MNAAKSEKKRTSGGGPNDYLAAQQTAKRASSSQPDYMTALKFNGFGNKLAGISQNGNLYLWHFNVPRSIFRREFRAYYTERCHDKLGSDLVFVRGSSCLATAGDSSNGQNVCIWDLLYGDRSRCLIRSYCCYEGTGANCIEHCADIDSLVVGGQKGSLNMFDQRIPFPILKWDHGQSRIWKLQYHAASRQLLVGTLEGHVSVWDVRKLYARSTLSVHSSSSSPHSAATGKPVGKGTAIPFDDLAIPEERSASMLNSGRDPLRKSSSAPDSPHGDGSGDASVPDFAAQTLSTNDGSAAANRGNPTSISYSSINAQGSSSVQPLNLDADCVVNEWKLYSRKTFLNHSFGSATQLGYLASVGLTDATWTADGNILCTGSDGAVKYLRRKTKIYQ